MATQAERIISAFGGINATARALGHKNASTVQGWMERGAIPSKQHLPVWEAAKRLGKDICLADFAAVPPEHVEQQGDAA